MKYLARKTTITEINVGVECPRLVTTSEKKKEIHRQSHNTGTSHITHIIPWQLIKTNFVALVRKRTIHISLVRVNPKPSKEPVFWDTKRSCLLPGFLLALFFGCKDRDMVLRNVNWLLTGYMALFIKRQDSSKPPTREPQILQSTFN
jgi:hypothetical protein